MLFTSDNPILIEELKDLFLEVLNKEQNEILTSIPFPF